MKHIKIFTIIMGVGFMVATSGTALAQVYSDDFATDTSLSGNYLNINSFSNPNDQWTFNADTGGGNGNLQLETTTSGQVDDVAGSFSQVNLTSAGQSITFAVNFNSAGTANGLGQSSASAGDIVFALDNSGGISLGGGGNSEAEGSSVTGGQTGDYIGYLGQLSLNTPAKSSTKFYAKTTGDKNALAYYSDVSGGVQIGAEANTLSASSSDNYTLTYSIAYVSATEDAITTTLTDDTLSTVEETWTVDSTSSSTPTDTFDTFDFGIYTGSIADGYDVNLTSIGITDVVPEPSVLALAGAGLGLLGLIRFRRS